MSTQHMTADYLVHSIAVLACATTLSLFTTIAAYATVNVAAAKSNGPACTTAACASALAAQRLKQPKPQRVAKAPSQAL